MAEGKRSESGQALVLIVLGIVGMLGFAALAIDGGRIYTDRRNMQNASDTSSLTAAASIANYMSAHGVYYSNWVCDDTQSWFISAKAQAFSDGIDRAAINGGYIIDVDASDNNGIMAQCGQEVHVGFTEKYIDVTTYITNDTPSSFAQFVFDGPLRQTVLSTARVYPQTSGGYGNAIVALNNADCSGQQNGVAFNGNIDVHIDGGGVFSNGCMRASGAHLVVDVDNGGNTYMSEYDPNGGPNVSPAPAQGDEPLDVDTFSIPAPDCSAVPVRTFTGSPMLPGRYSSNISVTSTGSNITMNPGLYCFYGTFKVTGGMLNGTGVTIYMHSGDLEVGGNVTVKLSAPLGTATAVAPAVPNLLVYTPTTHTGVVSLLGTAESTYGGTVFAPKANVKIGGNSGINPTYSTQIIGWNVEVSGTSDVYVNFDEEFTYQFPPRLDLNR